MTVVHHKHNKTSWVYIRWEFCNNHSSICLLCITRPIEQTFKYPVSDLHQKGGGGKEFIWAHSMGSNRGCPLCSAFQKSNSSSCLSCLVARALFKQFKIKRCLPLLVQICMIAHEAHICTAGIAHRRSGTKDLNDLTENRKRVIIVIFTVQKHQQCLN